MSLSSSSSIESEKSKCLVRSVSQVLAEEPTLEAVTVNRAEKTISVATLGKADVSRLTQKISETIERAEAEAEQAACGVLSGAKDCTGCSVPGDAKKWPSVSVKKEGDSTTIARVTCPTAPSFWRWKSIPWPRVVQRDVEFIEHEEHLDEWKGQLVAAGLCGVFGLTGYFLGTSQWAIWSFILAYLAGGWYTTQEVWEKLRDREIDVHFLMIAVAIGAASIGAWEEGTTLLFLFSLSGGLEHFALGRTHREINSLFKEAPKVATVLDANGRESEVAVERLRAGMRLLVKPGAQFPVDAEIVKGQTSSDESNLTGEATPVDKTIGDTVLAGTLNLWGAVEVVVVRAAKESSLQKIIHLIREAQQQKAPAQRFTDKFSTIYTYVVLGLSFGMFFVWWLVFKETPFASHGAGKSAFYHAMTLLVVASPCALVLSIPSAVLAAIASGARQGILFRGGAAVEKLAGVNTVALDKTGTLTTGELRVEKVESFPAGREQEIARLAYSLERLSTHPLARAITRYGKQQQLEPIEFEHFESVTGAGLQTRRADKICRLGKRDWLAEGECRAAIEEVPPTDAGFSEVWVSEDELVGRIVLRDDVRPQARQVIEELREEGLKSLVLTGDRKAAAEHLKDELDLDDVRAELKPEQKVAAIRELVQQGQNVAMVGDGVNDAPSLAVADVGVAMGARGSDAALEQAEVVLMHDRLENFLAAFRLSQRARRVIRQNLVISLGTVVVLMTFAMLGRIPLTLGVVGHEGSTVIVVMNSLRLLFSGKRRAEEGRGAWRMTNEPRPKE